MKYIFLILSFFALIFNIDAASVTIGPAAIQPLLSSQAFYAQQGFTPADNVVQFLNPPLFRWPYDEDPYHYADNFASRTFLFELSTNDFSSTYWSIITSNNYHNTLPAITNADGSPYLGTISWHIVYMPSNAVSIIATSAVHNFTLSPSATNWDRSALADSNYLYSVLSPHPHMWFWQSNRTDVSTYMRTIYSASGASSWTTLSNEAVQAVTNEWFTNNTVFTNIGSPNAFRTAYQLWEVAFVYQMTTNAYFLPYHPENFLDNYDKFWIAQGYDRQPTYGGSDYGLDQTWAIAIDYLWPLMSTAQRSNAVYAVEQSVKFYTYEDWWYEGSTADPTRAYPQSGWMVNADAASKGGDSHQRYDAAVSLMMCLSLWAESTNLQMMMPYSLNFFLGKKDAYEGDEGRGYNQAGNMVEPHGGLGADILTTILFSKENLRINPLYNAMLNQYSYMQPVFYHGLLEPWGDLTYGAGPFDTLFYNSHKGGLELGMVTQNGAAVRQYNRQNPTGFTEGGGYPQFEALIGYYYSTPAEADWPSTSYIDTIRGYAVLSSVQPNAFDAFTNAVGLVTQARPDAHINHGMYSDGSIQLWAYGAQVTAGGAGSYSRHPMLHSAQVMVNGMGPTIPRGNPTASTYARFTAFTNANDFAYIESDTKNAYQSNNFVIAQLAGNLLMDFYTTNSNPQLLSMKRRILFPHDKYLVLYDTMTAKTNTQFQWLWHYMETNNAVIDTNGCSVIYTCTNSVGSNVTVYIVPFINPSSMTLTNLGGTNGFHINPFTHEFLTDLDYYNIPEPLPNGNIWIYNNTPSTNWSFGFCIYVKRWDEPTPIFTRLDDFTIKVEGHTNDNSTYPGNWVAVTDTNTFNTNYSGAVSFMVAVPDVGDTNGGGGGGNLTYKLTRFIRR